MGSLGYVILYVAAILLLGTQPQSACLCFIDRQCVNSMLNSNIN